MTEHLIVFPTRDIAEETAEDLREEGFTDARVVRMASDGQGPQPSGAGEDDADSQEWGVHVVEAMVEDQSGAVEHGLRDRFEALAAENHGWYDPEPDLP